MLRAMFEKIMGECPYKSPTDMGVNMAGNAIVNDEVCREASRQEIIRRYYQSLCERRQGLLEEDVVYKLELLMNQAGVSTADRPVVKAAIDRAESTGMPRGHPAAGRADRHRQNLQPVRMFGRFAAQCTKGAGRYPS